MFFDFSTCARLRLLLAVFAFFWLDSWNSVDAQSTRRSSSTSPGYVQNNSAANTQVYLAYQRYMAGKSVKFDDHKAVFSWLTESSGQEKWRKIQWRHDLWDARIESAKTGKPIFIWAMNGDPLGCV